MARYYELSTDEQIWVMIRVKQGLMTMEDALEYVRSQHEQGGRASGDPRSPPGPGPGGGGGERNGRDHDPLLGSPATQRRTRNSAPMRTLSQDRMSSRSRGRSLLKHFSRQRSPPGDEDGGGSRISSLRPKSVGSSILVDKEWQRSDELLDLMVAQGKISRDDRDDLLKKFATDRNFKSGDAQRMILANLVKTGRISIDDAVHYSRLLGIVASAETEARTIAEVSNAFQEKRVYNFGVYKYYKHRTCQRRILQIDFQACQLCNIQKGNLNRKFTFATVTDYESEEGLRFFIYFKDHHEYELEADTLEEKEKICRLLHLIVEQNKSTATGRVLSQADFRGTLTQCQTVIKEGFLEKKNHNLYTTWTRRWVRIRQGELSYYKPDDDNQQALNILQLSREVNLVKKVNNNGFSISTRKKVYFFRVIVSGNVTAAELERHRDEWFKAIRYGCGDRRESVANLGDDSFNTSAVTTNGSIKSQRESINTMLKGYYEELEALNSVMGGMDGKSTEAKKTAMRLQQIIKHLESFITDYKPSNDDTRPDSSSGNSASLETDISSNGDRPANSLIENGISDQSSMDESASTKNTTTDSVRLSIIYRNSWAQFENNGMRTSSVVSCKDSDPLKNSLEDGKQCNGSEKITLSSIKNGLSDIFPRNSVMMNGGDITGGLETVPESKLENGVEATVANSNAAFLEQLDADANGNKPTAPTPNQNAPNNGHIPLILEDSLPPLPPPPPPQLAPSIPAPPAPPPPPVALVPIRTFKVKSKVKMRPFHWNKINNMMVSGSIWKTARDLTELIDTDVLEDMYSDKKKETTEPETSKRKLKSFLDPKVAQNLGIFLAGFKMDAEELKYRLTILSEQDGGLDPEHINVIRRYHPTAEDVETYSQYREKSQELEPTDQFMLQLCEIPHLKTRLDILLIVNEFPVQYEHLAPTIEHVLDSLDVLCHSIRFVSVLEYVLAVGNFINSGCSKGIAMGFKLATLPKLAECRARDKNFTLLKYLVQQIHKHEPDLLGFIEELQPIMHANDASIKALQAEVEVMKKDLCKLKKNASVLMKVENPPERDIAFCDDIEMFVESYEGKLNDLQDKSDDMKTLFEQMLMRFGENVNVESQEIFASIAEFVKAFKREVDLIMVTAGKHNRRKSKKYSGNPRKSMPRDSAIDSVTSLERSDSAESCPDQYDADGIAGVANLRKAFSADCRSAAGQNKRQGFIQDKTKAVSSPRTRKPLPKNPTKEGYMEKLSTAKSPLSSQWNRRYFELTTQGHLYYSKRKNEKNVESIYLRGCPVALEDDRTIVIQTDERCYKLKAASHEEAQEWLECLLVYTLKQANVPRRAHSQFPTGEFGL